jgi:DNA-binding NarL/FixJ family response regulator
MPEMNGITATSQIRSACPGTEVLILTMLQSDEAVREAIAAGARGFLLKTDASQLLVVAIEALLQHKPFFTGSATDVVLTGYLDPAQAGGSDSRPVSRLTPRETEILQLLAEALSNKEVASQLSLSVKTVEAHRSNIMRKLGAHSVTELVLYAVRNRIVQA